MSNPSPQKALEKPFSEVISASGDFVIAQCYKDPLIDSKGDVLLGSLVKLVSSYDNSHASFGLVTKISNSSIDSVHKPQALGLNIKELETFHPQLHDLLKKELEIYLFAHKENEEFQNYPPLKPALIHDFVYKVSENEFLRLTEDLSNIITIVKRYKLSLNLLYSLIKNSYKMRKNDYNYLLKTGKMLTTGLEEDLKPVMDLLKRLQEDT